MNLNFYNVKRTNLTCAQTLRKSVSIFRLECMMSHLNFCNPSDTLHKPVITKHVQAACDVGTTLLLELDFYTQLRRRFTTGDSQRIMSNPSRVMISFLLFNSPRLCSQIRTLQAILSPKEWKVAICNVDLFNHWVRKKNRQALQWHDKWIQMVTIPGIPSNLVS